MCYQYVLPFYVSLSCDILPACVLCCLLSKYAYIEKKQVLSSLLLCTKNREMQYKQRIAEDKVNLNIMIPITC